MIYLFKKENFWQKRSDYINKMSIFPIKIKPMRGSVLHGWKGITWSGAHICIILCVEAALILIDCLDSLGEVQNHQ